jgi:hypothetical protein
MSDKKVGVFGIYSNRAAVENAAGSLVKAGFPLFDISVLLPETLGGLKDIGTEKALGTEKATKALEGAAAGVTAGGVIGGTVGLLAGAGLLAIRPIHGRRSNHGRAGGAWRRRSNGRSYPRLDRYGYP